MIKLHASEVKMPSWSVTERYFSQETDSTILIKQCARGAKFEGAVRKRAGLVTDGSTQQLSFSPDESQKMVIYAKWNVGTQLNRVFSFGPCSEQPIQTIRKKFNSPAEQNIARHTQRLISMMDKLTHSHLKKWNRRARNCHKNWICTTSRH